MFTGLSWKKIHKIHSFGYSDIQRTLYAQMLICTHTLANTPNTHIFKYLKQLDTEEIFTQNTHTDIHAYPLD